MSPWRVSGQFRFDGLFVVPTLLNNQPFKFLFDPGAAYSTIKPSVAKLLDLQTVGNRRLLQGGYYLIDCPVYQLDSFQIGFIRRASVRVLGMPLDAQSGLHGLIGMDFLRQYRFTLEPDTATLILRLRRK